MSTKATLTAELVLAEARLDEIKKHRKKIIEAGDGLYMLIETPSDKEACSDWIKATLDVK